ncbi:MAG: hypothetical protein OXI69_06805 [Acidobacteriota bacterium]|nr:hypothetical protein [Acidobacteriota bacterium]
MNLTRHLIANDFRYLRPYLSVWWALLILQAVLMGSYAQLFSGERMWLFSPSFLGLLVAILKLCLLTLIVSEAVRKDATTGTTAFWLSRPISKGRLLASKSLFLALVVLLPDLLVQVVLLLVRGVAPEDTVRSIPQIVLLTLFTIVVLTMLTVLTTSLPRQIFFGIAALVAVPPLWFILFLLFSTSFSLVLSTLQFPSQDVPVVMPVPPPSFSLHLMGMLPVLLGIAAMVVVHQYLTRRRLRSRILLFSALSLALISIGFWNPHWRGTAPKLDTGILDPTRVTAWIEEKSLIIAPVTTSRTHFDPAGKKRLLLKGSIALDNLPPGVVVLPAQISASLLLPSGESLAHHVSRSAYAFQAMSPIHFSGRPLGGDRAELLSQALDDVKFLDGEHLLGEGPPELFEISKDLYERYGEDRLQYSAQVDYLVQRDEIANIRLEKGARYHRGSDQVEILSIDRYYSDGSNTFRFKIPPSERLDPNGLIIRFREFTHWLPVDDRNTFTYLLINPSRREGIFGLKGRRGGSSLRIPPLMSMVFPMLKVEQGRLNFGPRFEGSPLDPAWMDGAELIRVETRDLGWFSKSIRLEDLVMERIARPAAALSQPGKDS